MNSELSAPLGIRSFMSMSGTLISLIAITFLLAGLVKGMLGLGLPTVAMALLSLKMAPVEAAALLVVPSFVTNVWQLAAGPRFGLLLRRLWPMMIAICAGTWAGSGLIASKNSYISNALGVALIAYAALALTKPAFRVPARNERWAGPTVGFATGVLTGGTGVFVIPAVPYLGALQLDREDLIQALGLSFTVSTIALATGLVSHGSLNADGLFASLFALVPAMLGMTIGTWLRKRVPQDVFRRYFFIGLLLLGAELFFRGLI